MSRRQPTYGTIGSVLTLLAAPATNDRSPRYMERALAAIHQSFPSNGRTTFLYGCAHDRVGLFIETDNPEAAIGPLTAHYPNCTYTPVDSLDGCPPEWETWYADLILLPEVFPILRHAQFEDLLNGTFADPITGILRAVVPSPEVHCRAELHVRPATPRRQKAAVQAVRLLDRNFFRSHPDKAESYAEKVTRRWGRLRTWWTRQKARRSALPDRSSLDTSASRLHDREEDLQAASGKLGGHLFETHIR